MLVAQNAKFLILSVLILFGRIAFGDDNDASREAVNAAETFRRWQASRLEQLKKSDPVAYALVRKSMDQQAKIDKIARDFRNDTITEDQARRALRPLIADKTNQEISSFKKRLSALEKHFKFMKQCIKDPSLLLERRIGQILGLVGPDEPIDMDGKVPSQQKPYPRK